MTHPIGGLNMAGDGLRAAFLTVVRKGFVLLVVLPANGKPIVKAMGITAFMRGGFW